MLRDGVLVDEHFHMQFTMGNPFLCELAIFIIVATCPVWAQHACVVVAIAPLKDLAGSTNHAWPCLFCLDMGSIGHSPS